MKQKKQIGIVLGVMFVSLVVAFALRANPNQKGSEKQQLKKVGQTNLTSVHTDHVAAVAEAKSDPLASVSQSAPEQKAQRVVTLTREKQAELEGNTHNEYGIRQDILQFIEENVPKDNPKAFEAAIKLAQYENKAFYHASSQNEVVEAVRKSSLALACLNLAFPNDPLRFVNGVRVRWMWEKIYDGITKPMRDTPARARHGEYIDDILSGHLIGSGLSGEEERERCAARNF